MSEIAVNSSLNQFRVTVKDGKITKAERVDESLHLDYTTQEGDSLDILAYLYLGDSKKADLIFAKNNGTIRDRNALPIGKTITIPRYENVKKKAEEIADEIKIIILKENILDTAEKAIEKALYELSFSKRQVLLYTEFPIAAAAERIGQKLMSTYSHDQRLGRGERPGVFAFAKALYHKKSRGADRIALKMFPDLDTIPIQTFITFLLDLSDDADDGIEWSAKRPDGMVVRAEDSYLDNQFDFVFTSIEYPTDTPSVNRQFIDFLPKQPGKWTVFANHPATGAVKREFNVIGTIEQYNDFLDRLLLIIEGQTRWEVEALTPDGRQDYGDIIKEKEEDNRVRDFLSRSLCAMVLIAKKLNISPVAVLGAIVWEWERKLDSLKDQLWAYGSGRVISLWSAGQVHVEVAVAIELLSGLQLSGSYKKLAGIHRNTAAAAFYVAHIISYHFEQIVRIVTPVEQGTSRQGNYERNLRSNHGVLAGLFHGFFGDLDGYDLKQRAHRYRVEYAKALKGLPHANYQPNMDGNEYEYRRMGLWVQANTSILTSFVKATDIILSSTGGEE